MSCSFSRVRIAELMDDPGLDSSVHAQALTDLAKLNLFSLSASLLWSEIRRLEKQHHGLALRVLDLASGGGDIAVSLARKAVRCGIELDIVGVDVSQTAVEYARDKARDWCRVRFEQLDVINDKLPEGFDVIVTSLFTHHLDPPEVVQLLAKMQQSARKLVLVNDLVRTRLGLAAVYAGTRLLSKSPIVRFDGPASVKAAFTTQEFRNMALQAGLTGCRVVQCPPARQMLIWQCHAQ
jgi:2-polyprenyl-3-methyl-5-hydroxy-6-metoxy-1,4-benzoquinol methylase